MAETPSPKELLTDLRRSQAAVELAEQELQRKKASGDTLGVIGEEARLKALKAEHTKRKKAHDTGMAAHNKKLGEDEVKRRLAADGLIAPVAPE